MASRIEDYALIGDLYSAALVGRDRTAYNLDGRPGMIRLVAANHGGGE